MRRLVLLFLAAFMFLVFDGPRMLPPTGPVVSGVFSQYGRQPTEATIAYRREVGQIPPGRIDGYVALVDCGRVGEVAWLSLDGGTWLRVVVMDCSGHSHTTEWMATNSIIGEIDYFTALKYDTIGRGIAGRIILEGR